MEKKRAILKSIKFAKSEHLRWITYAEAKFDGMEVDDNKFQKGHTECECGKWILEKGQILSQIKSAKNLMDDHKEFHNLYNQLYEFMESQSQGNIFTKMIVQKKNLEIMGKYAETLRKFSDNILSSFDEIYSEIDALEDDVIEKDF